MICNGNRPRSQETNSLHIPGLTPNNLNFFRIVYAPFQHQETYEGATLEFIYESKPHSIVKILKNFFFSLKTTMLYVKSYRCRKIKAQNKLNHLQPRL